MSDPTAEEKLMMKAVELGGIDKETGRPYLSITTKEIITGNYNHNKGMAGGKSLVHLAIEAGDAELFKQAYNSYELYIEDMCDDQEKLKKQLLGEGYSSPGLWSKAIDSENKNKRVEIIEFIYEKLEELSANDDSITIPDLYKEVEPNKKPLFHILAKDEVTKHLSILYKALEWNVSIKEAVEGIDVNRVDALGNTLLMRLVLVIDEAKFNAITGYSKEAEIKWLLEHGGDLGLEPSYTDRLDGRTVFDLVQEMGNQELLSAYTSTEIVHDSTATIEPAEFMIIPSTLEVSLTGACY